MQLFPSNSIFNARVDQLPVHPQSDAWIASIGAVAKLRVDDTIPVNFCANPPYVVINGLGGDSDMGLYPVPPGAVAEGGDDAHLVVVDQTKNLCCQIYQFSPPANGSVAARWDLSSNALRPAGQDSGEAAGLPMAPLILCGRDLPIIDGFNHALRFTAPHTDPSFIWPARHYGAGDAPGQGLPPMGIRIRLRSSFDVSSFSPTNQMILTLLKQYGAILADRGLAWAMQHDQDPKWNAAELTDLHRVVGSNFEVVDCSALMSSADSALAGPGGGLVMMSDYFGRPNGVTIDAFKSMLTPSPAPTPSNVALHCAATMSSILPGFDAYPHGPDKLTDGITEGNFYLSHVAHTNSQATPWFEVDLGQTRNISSIAIFNRTDDPAGGNQYLKDWWALLSDSPGVMPNTAKWGTEFKAPPNPNTTVSVPSIMARYVRVWCAYQGYANLAEIQVWGI